MKAKENKRKKGISLEHYSPQKMESFMRVENALAQATGSGHGAQVRRDAEAARLAREIKQKSRNTRTLFIAILLFAVLAGISGFFN